MLTNGFILFGEEKSEDEEVKGLIGAKLSFLLWIRKIKTPTQ